MAKDPQLNIEITINTAKLAAQAKKAQNAIKNIGAATQASSGMFGTLGQKFKEFSNSGKSLPALRYALYDIRNTLAGISAAFAAVAIAPIAISIQYERAFANVIRTNQLAGDSITSLRKELQQIAQATPISWEDITNIAALGGQLGIA